MKCRSEKIEISKEFRISDCKLTIQNRKSGIVNWKLLRVRSAFSLTEAVMALIILALVSSSVLVVINRCIVSAADSEARCRAFEVARENMEKILASSSVKEMVEYGSSDKYPEIEWQTAVESFYEPIGSRMWIRAVCLADYIDMEGEWQSVELTHWLTSLSKRQMIEIIEQRKRLQQQLLALKAEEIWEGQEQVAGFGLEPGTEFAQEPEAVLEGEQAPLAEPKQKTEDRPGPKRRRRAKTATTRKPAPRTNEPRPDWLPGNWDEMTKQEQLSWLFSTLSW